MANYAGCLHLLIALCCRLYGRPVHPVALLTQVLTAVACLRRLLWCGLPGALGVSDVAGGGRDIVLGGILVLSSCTRT